jgi:serine/threonine protein kinase
MVEALGHYRILDRIGEGGLGVLYRARDTRHGRTVALKVLAADVADSPVRREAFLHDARATASLSHPNIAALYEIGEDQNQLFLACEFVSGETLKNVIAGRPLHPRRAVDFAAQIADALSEAHAQGIVHRDINGGNIVITPKAKAKLLDFGLAEWAAGGAKRQHAASTGAARDTGAESGTGAHASPEQVPGGRVDYHTDIFSLGVVLFEMLTGRLPFVADTTRSAASQTVQTPPAAPSTINRTSPIELDAIVAKALARNPDERYASAATLAAELRAVAALLDARTERSESAGGTPVTIARTRSRSRLRWILLALLAVAAIAVAWFALQGD